MDCIEQRPLFIGDGRITKRCRECGAEKLLADMKADKSKSYGFANICKPCHRMKMAERMPTVIEKLRAYNLEYAKKNREKKRAYDQKARRVRYHKGRLGKLATTNSRRGRKRAATPAWANEFFIGEAYRLSVLRSHLTGIQWEVDHIVPIVSNLVCGLHCEQNLQVIPEYLNKKKTNLYWPDMP